MTSMTSAQPIPSIDPKAASVGKVEENKVDFLEQPESANRRQHFRVNYSSLDRPKISVGSGTGEVLDISEWGIRFGCPPKFTTSPGKRLTARVTFQDGKAFDIEGEVVRVDSGRNSCAMRLAKGFPLKKIAEEQRLVIKNSKKFEQ